MPRPSLAKKVSGIDSARILTVYLVDKIEGLFQKVGTTALTHIVAELVKGWLHGD